MSDTEDTKDKEFPILPLITLRGLIITPNANVQIVAARPKSIAGFEAALASDSKDIAIFCQTRDDDEEPDVSQLFTTGILCKVLTGSKRDQDTYKCLIRGTKRIRLVEVIDDENYSYRLAKYEVLDEIMPKEDEIPSLLEALKSALSFAMSNQENCVKPLTDENASVDLVNALNKEKNLVVLADMLSQILVIEPAEKRALLTTLDVKKRVYLLISLLNNYSYYSELMRKVSMDAKESMERNQKEYFLNEQLKAIKKELNADSSDESDISEYRSRLKALNLQPDVAKRIEKEIKKLSAMSPNASESSIVRNYIETLLSIPWNVKSEVNKDIATARDTLDADHYGLGKVKDRILEYLAVQSRSDKLHGPILCLMGPPGIGKTSLGASIAKATGRKYARVALGGLHDEAEIRGHRRTYIGSLPGRIISNMIKCGVNNPLFLLDEIDKVSSSAHGDPEAALLEVLDPEQNKAFNDNYVEIEYDLSNVMFIATANSYNISQPLLDRMEIIDLSSYTEEEKLNIATQHLLPKQMRLNTLDDKEFELTHEAIVELIRHYTYEAGVRGLERLINELCRKTVKDILLKKKKSAADEGKSESKRKSRIKKRVVDVKKLHELLGPRRYDFTSKLKENHVGLVNGLAWTSLGGDILQIEAVANEGSGKHILTGKLGDVMKESISAAITLVRSLSGELNLDKSFYEKCDLHVHVPEGATPKEGPSAGIGMVTAIVSALTGNNVRSDVAMTGEITLRGDVLAIGGLKEKLLAALRGGIKTVLIPKDNEKDLWDIPKNVKEGMTIIPVGNIKEVLPRALEENPFEFEPTTVFNINNKKDTVDINKETQGSAATPIVGA